RVLQHEPRSFEDRTRYLFELALGRKPSRDEVRLVSDYYNNRKSNEAAAWAGISSIILNLDEFITRE
ncbi:MAG: hypothetical protein ABIZ80_06810, partial [Bryobacteraceae bacterium]